MKLNKNHLFTRDDHFHKSEEIFTNIFILSIEVLAMGLNLDDEILREVYQNDSSNIMHILFHHAHQKSHINHMHRLKKTLAFVRRHSDF